MGSHNSFFDFAGLGDARLNEDIEALHQVFGGPRGELPSRLNQAWSSQAHTRLPKPVNTILMATEISDLSHRRLE
jgi:hypothetical protein